VGLDDAGSVHLVGQFEGTVAFGPSASTLELDWAGAADVFVPQSPPAEASHGRPGSAAQAARPT
jgi:hypothetical protein